jgi:DNA mismatch repair protein MutL
MRRVERLSDAVANQIAAGEVVERPASCVKELLENAIDAAATRVEIEVDGGGVELIRITDDGHGMDREDAVLALERHATSKIRLATDLHHVTTLGFRGEALPSIASVSRFVLTTQPRGSEGGTRITVEGGIVREVASAGAASGTSIEVRDLFYNVPARRKFLKTAQTEMSHITDAIVRLALAKPDVSFLLKSEGRTVLEVPRAQATDPRGRLGRILGKTVAEMLYPVAPDDVARAIEVRGFVSSPELNERTARSLFLFVNGRFVRDRTIQHAVQDAYRTLLEKNRHPVVVLELAIDPARVDVNVHPQKTEVRFEESGAVHRAVSGALSRTLAAQPWLKVKQPELPAARTYLLGGANAAAGLASTASRAHDALRMTPLGFAGPRAASPGTYGEAHREPYGEAHREPSRQLEAPSTLGKFGSLEPVGQVMATYLVCQAPGRMVVIDQHAAHERIAFERMKKQCAVRAVARQPLLVPMSIELDAARSALAHDARERLEEIGIELEPFGGNTWLVKSRPAAIGGANLETLVLDLLDELRDVGETTPMKETIESLLSCAACHTVVRAGDRLTAGEIKELLIQMDEIDFGAHCPHGRPVFVEWSERELASMFHRT